MSIGFLINSAEAILRRLIQKKRLLYQFILGTLNFVYPLSRFTTLQDKHMWYLDGKGMDDFCQIKSIQI